MSGQLAPIDAKYWQDLYGDCAAGDYHLDETILYHDGEVKEGTIRWIRAYKKDEPIYIVDDGVTVFNYIPEGSVISVVRKIEELSPV